MESEILKETMNDIKTFDEILKKQNKGNSVTKEERDFIEYFDFRLAESLLKELGRTAVEVAKHILVSGEKKYER